MQRLPQPGQLLVRGRLVAGLGQRRRLRLQLAPRRGQLAGQLLGLVTLLLQGLSQLGGATLGRPLSLARLVAGLARQHGPYLQLGLFHRELSCRRLGALALQRLLDLRQITDGPRCRWDRHLDMIDDLATV